ncbi:SCO family protein [Massilia sp. S19_KUP03_FR1]|uniref:SCO family protein n=1 Tax=Massilia sp. S19_KUP03_FR1 TaxID=3025503 RepID=UPI002FCD6E88
MTTSPSSNSTWTLAALLLVSALGIAALYEATLGFRIVSTESGRRLQISAHPLLLPPTALATPRVMALQENLRHDGRVAIVTFIYTRCNAICSVLGSQYQQMQSEIIARGMQHQIRLLSISFDERDTPAVLQDYAKRQHAQPAVWQFASVPDAQQRSRLLAAFGIVVLPAPLGEFQHNAAFHIVDRAGRLVRIIDLDDQDGALRYAVVTRDGS